MIKLTDILKEVKTNYKTTTKKSIRETVAKSRQLFVIEDVLSSGAFTVKESIALREFFTFRKSIPMLNENTVQLINKEMLKEGFLDWVKEKASSFKNALSGGWDKLKAAWANFKDFVASLVSQIKTAMKAMFDEALAKIKSALKWGADIAAEVKSMIDQKKLDVMKVLIDKVAKITKKPDIHTSIPKEVGTFSEQSKYLVNFVQTKIVSLAGFEEKAIKGEVKETPELGESIRLFKDKQLVETLIKITESELTHPEDALKKWPKLHKVVKVIIGIFKWTFGIFGTLVKKVGELISKNVFRYLNDTSQFIGGPVEATGFAAMTALVGELAEIAGHNMHKLHDIVSALITFISNKLGLLVPVLLPYIKTLEITFHVTALFFFAHSIVTTLLNTIVPAIKMIVEAIKANPSVFNSSMANK